MLLSEDIGSVARHDPNWWGVRTSMLTLWLQDASNYQSLPEDEAHQMIEKFVHRGEQYEQSRVKCWRQILLELQDSTHLQSSPLWKATSGLDSEHHVVDDGAQTLSSPNRGRMRPGKELIVLQDSPSEPNIRTSGHVKTEVTDGVASNEQETADKAQTASSRKFSSLTLIERQAKWLEEKAKKREQERQRQIEESERELTFQPKLMRRFTFSYDKPAAAKQELVRGVTFNGRSSGVGKSIENFLNSNSKAVRAHNAYREGVRDRSNVRSASSSRSNGSSSGRRKKKLAALETLPTTRRIAINSTLLNETKSELVHSILSSPRGKQLYSSEEPVVESPPEDSLQPEEAEVTVNNNNEFMDGRKWSDRPVIDGRNVEFTDTKAKLAVQDAMHFELKSMYRKTDRKAGRDGVALLMGRREDTLSEHVIAVLFDREKVSEQEAEVWWSSHRHRFVDGC